MTDVAGVSNWDLAVAHTIRIRSCRQRSDDFPLANAHHSQISSACANARSSFCRFDPAAANTALIASPVRPFRKQRRMRLSLFKWPIFGSTALRRLRRFFFVRDSRRVLLPATASASPIPVVSKVSSGGAEIVQLFRLESDGVAALASMRRRGWHLLATAGEQNAVATPLHHLDFPAGDASVVLLLGSEGEGLAPALVQLCHRVVRVTRPCEDGLLEHLNVGVAAALLLYGVREAQRRMLCAT